MCVLLIIYIQTLLIDETSVASVFYHILDEMWTGEQENVDASIINVSPSYFNLAIHVTVMI